MSTYIGVTTHRIIYKAAAFAAGKTVTAYIWNPSLTKSALQTFTEVSDGLYYLDYAFAVLGAHFGVFYENAVAMASGAFRIVDKTGYSLSDAGVDAVWDRNSSLSISFENLLNRLYQAVANNKMTVNESSGAVALRSIGDGADIATGSVVSSSGTTTRAELSWA